MDLSSEIRDRLRDDILFFSGAMGTIIQEHNISFRAPEELNYYSPDIIKGILTDYVTVGVDFIETNTFGGTEIKLREAGIKGDWKRFVGSGVKIAREVANSSRRRIYVIGNVGPIGKLIKPLGDIDFDEAYSEFYKQSEVLLESGVDGILLETLSCIVEARAAYLAVRDAGADFVMVQMTYSENGVTDTGSSPGVQVAVFEALGADVIGANCSVGPDKMIPIVEKLRRLTEFPISIQANAGIPYLESGKTIFPMGPDEYLKYVISIYEAGANIIGGCCGTTPKHLELIIKSLKGKNPIDHPLSQFLKSATVLASRSKTTYIGNGYPFLKIGEKINTSARKDPRMSLEKKDFGLFRRYVIEQRDNADVLDINVSIQGIDEIEIMRKALEV
jgi:5-methyltetrahydrofolate--homocysteine methyltransferase